MDIHGNCEVLFFVESHIFYPRVCFAVAKLVLILREKFKEAFPKEIFCLTVVKSNAADRTDRDLSLLQTKVRNVSLNL